MQNDPIEPSQLGIAVIDALDKFAPHITHAEMTAELERSMDRIAEGEQTKAEVVETSRNLLAQELANPVCPRRWPMRSPTPWPPTPTWARARSAARICN